MTAADRLCALWTAALTDGRHYPLRQRWPELAAVLDQFTDEANAPPPARLIADYFCSICVLPLEFHTDGLPCEEGKP